MGFSKSELLEVKMAIRLGIDASQSIASCAISAEHGIIAEEVMDKPIENFTVLIRKALLQAQVSLEEIDEIVVCIGPGSQTGVRATVVTGNALAFALGKPVIGVLSCDAGAVASAKEDSYRTAVSAGRRRWYTAAYEWTDQIMRRASKIQLVDDLPLGTKPSFVFDSASDLTKKTCAYDMLLIAEQQRQLIVPSLNGEILPYEFSTELTTLN